MWILHGLVDWLWEMPVLGVLGMALFGVRAGLRSGSDRSAGLGRARLVRSRRPGSAAPRPPPRALPCHGLPTARSSRRPPSLADRSDRGVLDARARPFAQSARRSADRSPARSRASSIEYAMMRARFQAAVNRSPDDWYANLELGIAASLTGESSLRPPRCNEQSRLIRANRSLATCCASSRPASRSTRTRSTGPSEADGHRESGPARGSSPGDTPAPRRPPEMAFFPGREDVRPASHPPWGGWSRLSEQVSVVYTRPH